MAKSLQGGVDHLLAAMKYSKGDGVSKKNVGRELNAAQDSFTAANEGDLAYQIKLLIDDIILPQNAHSPITSYHTRIEKIYKKAEKKLPSNETKDRKEVIAPKNKKGAPKKDRFKRKDTRVKVR